MSFHESPLSGMKVLVVEDDYFIGTDVVEALRSFGAEVIGPVSACDEALALLAHDEISTAVLDINLDGEAVFPVADELNSRRVPFVLATGYDPATIPDTYREALIVEKPYHMDVLSAALLRAAEDRDATGQVSEERDGLLIESGLEPESDKPVALGLARLPSRFAPDDGARFEV